MFITYKRTNKPNINFTLCCFIYIFCDWSFLISRAWVMINMLASVPRLLFGA